MEWESGTWTGFPRGPWPPEVIAPSLGPGHKVPYSDAERRRSRCHSVVHGDMSGFYILLGADGPVIIDLPQAVDAAANNHAPRMLVRDVDNLRRFFGRFAPELTATDYGKEIWALYEAGALTPETPLTGRFVADERHADLEGVMREIDDARLEEAARLMRMQEPREH